MSERTILVTNDDGITAKGIAALVGVAKQFGKVVVVAPDSPQSGMGHAVTLGKPLFIKEETLFEGIEAYSCSGTPVDCVKWAVHNVLKNQLPDFCFSGINHGANNSINILYSGTMSAAMEGAIQGINSIGFSSLDYSVDADMSTAAAMAKQTIEKVISDGMPDSKLLNVNIPRIPLDEIKGFKLCRQTDAKWVEEFDESTDPHGRKQFTIKGKFVNFDTGKDNCVWALAQGYVSVVPVQFDLTSYPDLDILRENWKLNGPS